MRGLIAATVALILCLTAPAAWATTITIAGISKETKWDNVPGFNYNDDDYVLFIEKLKPGETFAKGYNLQWKGYNEVSKTFEAYTAEKVAENLTATGTGSSISFNENTGEMTLEFPDGTSFYYYNVAKQEWEGAFGFSAGQESSGHVQFGGAPSPGTGAQGVDLMPFVTSFGFEPGTGIALVTVAGLIGMALIYLAGIKWVIRLIREA